LHCCVSNGKYLTFSVHDVFTSAGYSHSTVSVNK